MQQNELFDVIILGASIAGIALADYIKAKSPATKIALVSKHFKFLTPKDKLCDTVCITGESAFSSFNHGLVILMLKDKRTVVGKNLVIATGGAPIKSASDKFKANKNICYSPFEAVTGSRNKPAVVYGNGQDAVNFALAMAKRFKYVYLCSSVFDLSCDQKSINKLNMTANVVHLPNCSIISCKNDKEGGLSEVTLSTYDTITCSALVLALGRLPDVNGIDNKMIELDSDRYIRVDAKHRTTKIANIYAIGECTRHNTKRSIATVGNQLATGGNK